jgi:hypothetical protein
MNVSPGGCPAWTVDYGVPIVCFLLWEVCSNADAG